MDLGEDVERMARPAAKRKSGRGSKRRFAREAILRIGPNSAGRRCRVERLIDRDADWYEETVVEVDTGIVLCDMAEPFACHRLHGAAKRRGYRDAVSWALDTIAQER